MEAQLLVGLFKFKENRKSTLSMLMQTLRKLKNNGTVSKEINMALECDKLAKEETLKRVSEYRR